MAIGEIWRISSSSIESNGEGARASRQWRKSGGIMAAAWRQHQQQSVALKAAYRSGGVAKRQRLSGGSGKSWRKAAQRRQSMRSGMAQ